VELLLSVDRTSSAPRHRQIYDALRSSILSGRLRAGDRIPATRALAVQLAISRSTVSEAYDQLQAEGYIQAKLGSGTYVAGNLPEDGLQVVDPKKLHVPHRGKPVQLSSWGRQAAQLPPSPTSDFQYDFRAHGIARDSFCWGAWRAAVERATHGSRISLLSYPSAAGHLALRVAIASHVARYRAVSCTPDEVVIVNGSLQGLNLLSHLLLDSGQRAAVEDPGYPKARIALETRGLQVTRVPVDAEGLIVEQLDRAGEHRLVMVTASHQDPTGTTMSLGRRLALLEVSERTGCLIVEDDYDSEFRYEGRPVESLQGLDRNGLVVYAGTFSKSVLPGLRMGFLVLPVRLVSAFVAAKSMWDGGTPVLEQAVMAEFMQSGDFERHIRRMRRLYRERRDALVAALAEGFGSRALVGVRHGGLNVLVELDVHREELEIVRRAAVVGVGLHSASSYYSTPPSRPTFLMGFAALSSDQIGVGIEKLARALA
jgi:GntR family transcriptional regulator / MocR family aminotransferase